MEFDILYALQNLHSDFLDKLMLMVTSVIGEYGLVFIVFGAILCIFKKTRKCGIAVIISYLLVLIIGNFIMKNLIARERPCALDTSVMLLVEKPTSFSCPSVHTAFAFSFAMAVFMYYKKWGIVALVFALLVAFSRMYLFVHFPSDVLIGAVLGVICGFFAFFIVRFVFEKISKSKEPKSVK